MAIYLGSNQVRAVIMPDGLPNIQSLSISQNGTYSVSGSISGYNPITVEVLPNIQSLIISQNGTYSISGSVSGYNPITVEVMPTIQSLTVSQNGVYTVNGSISGFNPVTVDITQRILSSVIAYSGGQAIRFNNSTIGYNKYIIFSNVVKQPDNFIILLTPQQYNPDITSCRYEVGWLGTYNSNFISAIFNIIYNGTITSTYLMGNNDSAYYDDNSFTKAHLSSIYLISWSYNSITQQMTCSLNSDFIGDTFFTAAPSAGFINYPAPAYTLYYI